MSIEDHSKNYLKLIIPTCTAKITVPTSTVMPPQVIPRRLPTSQAIAAAGDTSYKEGSLAGCQTAHANAEAEASGGMNTGEYAMVAGVAQQAVQTQQKEGGASTAHYGSAGINGVLGAASASRFMDCESAISECEETCGKVLDDPPGTKARAEEVKNKCVALSGNCSAAGMQAVLSLAQAGVALAAALTTKDPKDKAPDPEKEPDPTPPPPNPGGGGAPPPPIAPAPEPGGPRRPGVTQPGMPVPAPPGSPVKEPKPSPSPKPSPKPGNPSPPPAPASPGEEEPSPGTSIGPGGGGSKSSSPTAALSGNQMGGKLGRLKNRDPKRRRASRGRGQDQLVVAGGGSGGFSGSGASGMTGLSHQGSMRRGGSFGRKIALNKRPGGKASPTGRKQGLAQGYGQHDSIFKKASALIKNYCSRGNQCEK